MSRVTPSGPDAGVATGAEPRLAGDLTIWLVIGLEMMTFALMFLSFAVMHARHPVLFEAGRRTLDLHAGALNTVLLVSGSWCVARAVRAATAGDDGRVKAWLAAALTCGAGFVLFKSQEYAHHAGLGLSLSTDDFWMFYWLLTGFHFLHVLAAMAFLAVLLIAGLRPGHPVGLHALETGAAFWHMVDLLWLVLFPLVYVMR